VPTGRSRDPIKSLIFCAPEVSSIQRLRGKHPDALIIAAGQSADADEWLDAIQAGADDYCAAPFNPAQLRWILHSNLFADRMAA
jgi:DNA-binding response OmpR family regulator